ncbi:MAG: hypothetical protein H0W50_07395 [Parachlamydiaceae bacterium]|nr:hypothetical protein [Parachlamydiaceae bacterium]
MKIARNLFEKMTSLIHIFECWDQYSRGKRKRQDIQCFERDLENNIFQLQQDLITHQYQHSTYDHFYVSDPKQRQISRASVRDRLVHQIVYAILTPIFDRKFIFHSLSSRLGKGTHTGVLLLHRMIRKVSMNGKQSCYALKMDIKRFFDTVNHQSLKTLIRKNIGDENALRIIEVIIDSFKVKGPQGDMGIPLGNATSQIFANIYLHELDNFIKQKLRERYYLRYCDDFIILSCNENHLKSLIPHIQKFLYQHLQLELHPKKLIIRKLNQGIDFVGYVLFLKHKLVRIRTKQRMKKRLKEVYENYLQGKMESVELDQRLQSYLGILSHANEYKLSQAIKNAYWVRKSGIFD